MDYVTFKELVAAARSLPYAFPTPNNRIAQLIQPPLSRSPEAIAAQAAATRPIIHERMIPLIERFLDTHKQHGSAITSKTYQDMTVEGLLDRLVRKRPLMFMTEDDLYLLREGKTTGHGGFDAIGTDEEQAPLVMADYMSYPEMQLAAMLGVSVPTFFINDGDRFNKGNYGMPGTFEEAGVYVGLVGARFERPGLMEWKHMIITPEQNTPENGYGSKADPNSTATKSLAHWAAFYGLDYFPDYQEVKAGLSDAFVAIDSTSWLHASVFKQRMRMIAEPFLIDANARAAVVDTKAYVIAVGFGIGVWAIKKVAQAKLLIQAFAEAMQENHLPYISDLTFSWYPDTCTQCGQAGDGEIFTEGGNEIRIHFNKRNPLVKLTGQDEGKLLVASYAWDGNSYPGNEYWQGSLSASGDPAAACCSTIPELQNPEINPAVSGANVHVARTGKAGMIPITAFGAQAH